MAHVTNRRRVKRAMQARKSQITGFMAGQTDWGGIDPLTRSEAEQLAAAVKRGLDLWAWLQGRVQFLSARQIDLAMEAGLASWVETVVNGADSSDPFFTHGGWAALEKFYPGLLSIESRCAGARDGGHSCWAYGPVYLSQAAAVAAGYEHQIDCSCGRRDFPILP